MSKKKNLTISIDSELISAAQKQAKRRGFSLNQMIRDFLAKEVGHHQSSQSEDELMDVLNEATSSASKAKWSRSDAYEN